jgi:hypothetical protein
MHSLPLKHMPDGHEHINVGAVKPGPHPQAPVAQVPGKSPAPVQQDPVNTVPPDARQETALSERQAPSTHVSSAEQA